MSKKDYILIAETIAKAPMSKADKAVITLDLADAFSQDNPRFDKNRFITASRKYHKEQYGEG